MVTVNISSIKSKTPRTSHPVEGSVKIVGVDKKTILGSAEDISEVGITPIPIYSIEVLTAIDAEQIIKIDFKHGFHLLNRKVEFVCHFVGEEECFLPCHIISDGIGTQSQCQHGDDGEDVFLHC